MPPRPPAAKSPRGIFLSQPGWDKNNPARVPGTRNEWEKEFWRRLDVWSGGVRCLDPSPRWGWRFLELGLCWRVPDQALGVPWSVWVQLCWLSFPQVSLPKCWWLGWHRGLSWCPQGMEVSVSLSDLLLLDLDLQLGLEKLLLRPFQGSSARSRELPSLERLEFGEN